MLRSKKTRYGDKEAPGIRSGKKESPPPRRKGKSSARSRSPHPPKAQPARVTLPGRMTMEKEWRRRVKEGIEDERSIRR
jgi:hypothetical protein